jgi:hypothetical protein
MAKEAGFDMSKEEWLRHQAKQVLGLSDAELEGVAGGKGTGPACLTRKDCDSMSFCTAC